MFDQRRLETFWWFVCERHRMFVRRVVAKLPPPWTDDPILGTVYFTNVYRELDRGTRYVINEILPKVRGHRRDGLWNLYLYRLFNLITTYERLGGYQSLTWWDPVVARAVLRSMRSRGERIFTGAFMVAAGKTAGVQKYKLMVQHLGRTAARPWLLDNVLRATSMAGAHEALTQLPGIADFMAYEIVIDACYDQTVLPFNENDWVNPGPGAKLGAAILVGQGKRLTALQTVNIIDDLWDHQDIFLHRFGEKLLGPPLTLRNVEHCLCEFQKYWRAKTESRAKRNYTATDHNQDLRPWANVPPVYWQGL